VVRLISAKLIPLFVSNQFRRRIRKLPVKHVFPPQTDSAEPYPSPSYEAPPGDPLDILHLIRRETSTIRTRPTSIPRVVSTSSSNNHRNQGPTVSQFQLSFTNIVQVFLACVFVFYAIIALLETLRSKSKRKSDTSPHASRIKNQLQTHIA